MGFQKCVFWVVLVFGFWGLNMMGRDISCPATLREFSVRLQTGVSTNAVRSFSLNYKKAEHGGDFEIVSNAENTNGEKVLVAVLADVSGHGTEVETKAKKLKEAMAFPAGHFDGPFQYLQQAEKKVGPHDTSVAAYAAMVNPTTKTIRLSSAGMQNPVFLIKKGIIESHSVAAPSLSSANLFERVGSLKKPSQMEIEIPYESGDILVMVTDGVDDPTGTTPDPKAPFLSIAKTNHHLRNALVETQENLAQKKLTDEQMKKTFYTLLSHIEDKDDRSALVIRLP